MEEGQIRSIMYVKQWKVSELRRREAEKCSCEAEEGARTVDVGTRSGGVGGKTTKDCASV
jgi:hypothetical protein